MKMPAVRQVKRAFRRLWRSAPPGGMILLYHRIAEVRPDPQLLSVSPRHFSEHLEVLGRHYRPMPLREMVEALRQGKVPPGSVAITFDDGYADNLYQMKPLLERYGVPATVFVALGYAEKGREFWWDELERCLLEAPSLPVRVELTVGGKQHSWDIGDSGSLFEQDDASCWCWNVEMEENPTTRHRAYRSIHSLLKSLSTLERERALDHLRHIAGFEGNPARPGNRPLSLEEVHRLGEGDLVEIGAHTLMHPLLAAIPPKEQRREIEESKRKLEDLLEHPVTSFSYPYGGKGDCTAEAVMAVREAGFHCACSNFPGWVVRRTDPYQLPRFLIRDWDGEEFERRLQEFVYV